MLHALMIAILLVFAPDQSADSGTISGTVYYRGDIPPARRHKITRDEDICGGRSTEQVLIKVDEKHRVNEAVVFISGIAQGRTQPVPDKPVVLDQRKCVFEPHVIALRAGQPLEVLNSDDTAHNIHSVQGHYTVFNILQPHKGMRTTRRFDRPGLFEIKCNVHPWMNAKLHVFDHPYFVVTGSDGAFLIEGVPPGEYELCVWQEHLGEQRFPIKIKPGRPVKLDLTLRINAGK